MSARQGYNFQSTKAKPQPGSLESEAVRARQPAAVYIP
eukprot:COSAG01_NODE_19125_length_1029_cov_1.017204_4_plen_37_part_01